ncbi:MAG: hypothetical protein R3C12_08445 [Planctomycetaceae bacterium]|nr:hypothetical protein [Planctomycetaceae bacterium]
MATFIAAMVVFAAAVLGMAIGVITSNRCLKGTCGGLNNLPDSSEKSLCDVCASHTAPMQSSGEKA